MSTLEDHFSDVVRQKSISALFMIDLDFFKKINDEHGHNVGDKILQQFSAILSNTLRAGDIAARWGGKSLLFYYLKLTKNNQCPQLTG